MSLVFTPWSFANRSQEPARAGPAIARLLPTRLLPALLDLVGLSIRTLPAEAQGSLPHSIVEAPPERIPEALQPLVAGHLAGGESWALVLRYFAQGDASADLRQLQGSSASNLVRAALELLEAQLATERCPAGSWALAHELGRGFGSLDLERLEELCLLLDDIEASSHGDPESEARLARLDRSELHALSGLLWAASQGESHEPIPPVHARSIVWLGLALGYYGLAERGYVVMREGASTSTALRARIALRLAEARFERGHIKGYVKLVGQAAELDPEDLSIARQQATVLLVQGRREDAREAWERLVEREPSNPGFHLGLGQAHSELGQLEPAIAACLRALDGVAPGDTEQLGAILATLCGALIKDARSAEVVALAQRYEAPFKENPGLVVQLASAQLMEHRYGAAVELLEEHTTTDPEDALSLALLARARLALARPAAAVEAARQACQREPNQELWKIGLAEALVENGEHEEAARLFGELAAEGPVASATYMVLMARSHEQAGALQEADEWFCGAIGGYPDSHFARSEYGAFLIEQKRAIEAVDLLSTLLETHPRYREGLENLQSGLLVVLKQGIATGEQDVERWKALLVRTNETLAEEG